MENNIMDRELGWEDEIEHDGEGFTLLPEGDYQFRVLSFERGRYQGGAKLPPCNKAELKILLESPQGSTTIIHNLFLHTKVEGLLCAFFTAIGQRKHGEKLRMNWGSVVGAVGRCKVSIRAYTGNDGKEHKVNQIDRFYEPETSGPAPAKTVNYTPGTF